jgi:hypothetical protein
MNNNNNKFNITVNEESLESQHQNVHFSDQTPQWDYVVVSMPDPTFNIADTNDADLENFFSRPVKIQSYSWATGTNLFETFNPWQDFFENPRVLNRITNFNLLRCKLKVRIVLNGNGFHYGRAIASYVPLHTLDVFTKDRSFFIQDVVAASQRPHVYLDPTTSQGGTLTLPFVWYENALRIPSQEWREMGDIIIHGMQNLKHANGATDQVIVSVFAWAEEVSLSIPTANEPGALSPQMGEVFTPQAKDEYGTGPISRPAGIVAKAAGALNNVPGIGMYARATQMAANAVSGIASMFGYSRPVELASIQPYKPTLLGNMANTNVPDTSQKLTLDVKQELTIDPRVMGLGSTDEMTIKSIAQRESFLTQFGWAVADSAETLLWNSEVSPVLWNELTGTNDELHMPACCFAALPFRRWRGSMKFRFQIVASSFHKGRLKITYDPSYPLTNEYNTNYTYIIDLAKERDFTVEIGWGHEKSLINHRNPIEDAIPYSATALGADPGNNANGIISVYVVNDLTVPNSTTNNDIEVNVFVSAGDDFEVFDPESRNIEDLVWFEPQVIEVLSPQMAEMNQPDADLTKREDEPMKQEPSQTMAPTLSDQDHTICVYYGDPVTSFRQCLKRYNYHSAVSPSGSIILPSMINLRNSNFPYYRGYAPGAVHETLIPVAATPYNYCKMTLLNYITPAFTCRRGGLRWKYFRTGGNTEETSMMMVSRDASSVGTYDQQETAMVRQGSGNQFDRVRQNAILIPHTWDGAVVTSTRQNPVVEAEIPFYANVRFFPAKQANMTGEGPGFQQFHWMSTIWTAAGNDAAAIHCFVSVGEDYNLGFFTGAPVAWRVPQESEPASTL